MKATGIVRRIDDLGRVVIPKEIRRTMRIREGDPLEIYTDKDGGVIFRKYSLLEGLADFAGMLCDSLNRSTGRLVLPGGWEISSGVELSAKKFSGVTDILWADYILPSDFNLCMEHFSVTEGNFRMMVINEGKIIADVQPGDNIDLLIEDLTGPTYVRIAGESAAFRIVMSEFEYDFFEHP